MNNDKIENENLDITFTEDENKNIELVPELKGNIIPTNEVFAENNLENLTYHSIVYSLRKLEALENMKHIQYTK
jgi:hypothetical protein